MESTIDNFLNVSFHRDDTGERCRMWISYNTIGKVYSLNCSVGATTPDCPCLNPDEKYYAPRWGEDKDGWLVKWDDYNIYNLFRSALMKEIERKIQIDETRICSVQENYNEIAGK